MNHIDQQRMRDKGAGASVVDIAAYRAASEAAAAQKTSALYISPFVANLFLIFGVLFLLALILHRR